MESLVKNQNIRSEIRFLFLANFLTISGTSLAFIPLAKYFSSSLGLGLSFSVLLIARLLPGSLFANGYVHLANRFGIFKVIMFSQMVAGILSLGLLVAVHFSETYLALVSFSLACTAAAPLMSFFPGVVNRLSESEKAATSGFSKWYFAQYLSRVVTTALGGYLEGCLSINVFILLDSLTFFSAFLIWRYSERLGPIINKADSEPGSNGSSWRIYVSTINLTNFTRQIFSGALSPLLATIITFRFLKGSATIGNLYLFLGLAAMAGSALGPYLKTSFLLVGLGTALEFTLVVISLCSSTLPLFFVCLILSTVIMARVEVGLQTMFISRNSKSESDLRSAVFAGTHNAGLLLGLIMYTPLSRNNETQSATLLLSILALASLGTLVIGRILGKEG
ncbi:MAG: hypothetical protein HY537_05820 [Deltaproteobacteria bacterium]|nr:hypothetical protein [Deltaproteobacteria bacterium]